jgi:hypothetical protein
MPGEFFSTCHADVAAILWGTALPHSTPTMCMYNGQLHRMTKLGSTHIICLNDVTTIKTRDRPCGKLGDYALHSLQATIHTIQIWTFNPTLCSAFSDSSMCNVCLCCYVFSNSVFHFLSPASHFSFFTHILWHIHLAWLVCTLFNTAISTALVYEI